MTAWRPILEFPYDYPERFLVAAVDDPTGEVSVFVCTCADHGQHFPVQYGEQDKRQGIPFSLEEEDWRPYAWTPELPPVPKPAGEQDGRDSLAQYRAVLADTA